MLTPQGSATHPLPHGLTISESSLSMGLLNIGARGSGKTTFLALLALLLLRRGRAQVIIDPLGTLSEALIFLLLRSLQDVPQEHHAAIWRRLRYIDVGNTETVTPFPIYYQQNGESLWDTAERLLYVLELSHPNLITQSSVTWPKARRAASNAGAVLASLGFQLTEVEDLFYNTLEWEKAGRFRAAITRCPEASPAVSYFREEYPSRRSEKLQVTGTFLDHVYRFSRHPSLRLLFGASVPGIDWEEVESLGQTVILDFKHVSDPEVRRFAMLWIFQNLYEHIKRRGRRPAPFGLIFDELADLTMQVTENANPLAALFDEFLQRYMRNHRIFFSCAFQSLNQIDHQLRNTLLSLGTLVVGQIGTLEEARVLADVLYTKDPYRVKHWRMVWGTDPFLNDRGRTIGREHVVIAQEPQHMPLPEQLELASQKLTGLQRFHFLTRPALREGEVSQSVIPISIDSIVRDRKTGEYVFVDQELVERVRVRLAAQSGIPAAMIRQEQEARLKQETVHARQPAPPPPAAKNGSHAAVTAGRAARLPAPAAPSVPVSPYAPLRTGNETQSHPTLTEEQKAMLAFLIEHPDTSIAGVYKGLGISGRKGTEMRDSLREQGFLLELELRSGKPGAGRPMKCILPSFQAFAKLGIAPPKGRGSVIHRHLQDLVAEGAMAKGYSTHKEKVLANGAIVDVHLENGQETIAVEIAIASRPELELAHFRNCLAAGYDQVYAIFADDTLLARTEAAVGEAFTDDVASRVRLLPVSKIASVGMVIFSRE